MEKFIPFEKLSKKERRKYNAQRRNTWGGLNPVTRKPENPKAYNRKRARSWNEDSTTVPSFFVGNPAALWYNVRTRTLTDLYDIPHQ